MFKTDLNERERAKFSKLLRDVSEQSGKAAVSLEAATEDYSKFIIDFIVVSFMLSSLQELSKIVTDAAMKAKDEPEFPPIIGA